MSRYCATAVRRWAAILLLWLVGALVLAQSQGLVHSLVHGHPFRGVASAPVHSLEVAGDGTEEFGPDHQHDEGHAAHDPAGPEFDASWLLRLFVGHDDESTCRLFDQSSHADCLPSLLALVLPPLPPVAALALRAIPTPQLAPVPSRARGPPTPTS